MAAKQAKTLQIFLPTGEPRGIRIAELTTRIVQAVLIPRSELASAKSRPELDHLAVYFLFGESEEAAKPILYVGQTEDVRKRLDYHNANKDFWKTAVLIISKTHSFTQAHIRYLEWFCLQQAKAIGRFTVDNDQTPNKPFVPEPIEADLTDSYETITTLVSTLGYPVFQSITQRAPTNAFFIERKGVKAFGELVEDGFVVRSGSTLKQKITPSALDEVSSIRSKLVESGVLNQNGESIAFVQDYLFASPSGAATAVLGRRANGWVNWKDSRGRTLHEVKRSESDIHE